MTEHRSPRFSSYIDRSDGIDASEALARAELHLGAIRETVSKGIADSVGLIGALVNSGDIAQSEDQQNELHAISDGILSVAGMYGYDALGKVAYSLCDLIHVLIKHQRWDVEAVRLHYDAMRLLQAAPDLDANAQMALVDGLEKVVKAISVPDTAEAITE